MLVKTPSLVMLLASILSLALSSPTPKSKPLTSFDKAKKRGALPSYYAFPAGQFLAIAGTGSLFMLDTGVSFAFSS
jgi:hypothetical protein